MSTILTALAVASAGSSFLVWERFSGWGGLLPVVVPAVLFHIWVNRFAARRVARQRIGVLTAMPFVLSDIVLPLQFLLLVDAGDGEGWVILTSMRGFEHIPTWYAGWLRWVPTAALLASWTAVAVTGRNDLSWVRGPSVVASATGLLLLTALAVAVTSSATRAERAYAADRESLTSGRSRASIGEPPATCPQGEEVARETGRVGRAPVWWIEDFEQRRVVVHMGYWVRTYGESHVRTARGLESEVVWHVEGPRSDPIEVRVTGSDGTPMLLEIETPTGSRMDGVLDPRLQPLRGQSHDASGTKHVFRARMFVPESGCYIMEARWLGGGWTIPFAVGW